jgi:hypothetical protein
MSSTEQDLTEQDLTEQDLTEKDLTRAETENILEQKAHKVASILEAQSTHVESVDGVSLSSSSFGDAEVTITLCDGGPEERFDLKICGVPTDPDARMTVRASYGQTLQNETSYADDNPRIGVSVMSRDVKSVARDIDRRLLPDARSLYNKLLARLQTRKQKERKRARIAETVTDTTSIELTKSRTRGVYYNDRVFFGREEPRERHLSQSQVEPQLEVKMEARGELKVEIDHLSSEETVKIVKAIEGAVDGEVHQEPPRNRE